MKLAYAAILLSLSAACEGPTDPMDPGPVDPSSEDMASSPDLSDGKPPLPIGMPIIAEKGKWTWVDFPDSACNDGSATGIGINPGDSKNVLIFMMGGGACWDYTTCFVFKTASVGPVQKAQFEQFTPRIGGTVLDRAADTPFKDWNLVFVPYCTGDIHGGDKVAEYMGGGQKNTWHHKGRANMQAFLKRLAPTFPAPSKLVVSGSSAGGYGASVNYDLARRYFAGTERSYLIDDCGPALVGDDIPRTLRDGWYSAWNLESSLGDVCPECKDDMSKMVTVLGTRYPKDRLGLLAFTQDRTIRSFLLQSAADFEVNINRLAKQVLDPMPNGHYFYIKSESHTMLGNLANHTSQGVKLTDWIKQQVSDDPAWKSQRP